ncbi:Hypothetical protein CINCED_3A021019 [Cinara cedri]|uniref:Reverse transcriptase domain n=1 Tax=Cinara cedri TaxID=506608 RepID=A0A5E4MSW2_9HEMI|nr:Hypothetical protein CINCED_3A021019 [Cinara cedri]
MEIIRDKRLQWAGHTWRSLNLLMRTVLEVNPTGKNHCKTTMKSVIWSDLVRRNVEALGEDTDWKIQAFKKENWNKAV